MPHVVLYALGAGAGHLARASIHAERALAHAASLTILHSASAPRATPAPRAASLVPVPRHAAPHEVRALLLDALGPRGDRALVVDTFPAGLGGEVDDDVLARAAHTTLVRRYVKPLAYPDYGALSARYARWVFPYASERCEWGADEAAIVSSRHVGTLVRTLPIARGPLAPLAVIGDPAHLGARLRARLPRGTAYASGPLTSLPPARAYLGTSAGYHLTYELDAVGAPYGLVPQDRRYDDPFLRAERLGRAVLTPRDVDRLVEEAA